MSEPEEQKSEPAIPSGSLRKPGSAGEYAVVAYENLNDMRHKLLLRERRLRKFAGFREKQESLNRKKMEIVAVIVTVAHLRTIYSSEYRLIETALRAYILLLRVMWHQRCSQNYLLRTRQLSGAATSALP
eukprot:IDg20151t1